MPSRQLQPTDPILVGEKDARESHNLLRALVELGFRNVTEVNSIYKFLQFARVQKFSVAFIGSTLGGERAVDALGNVRTSSENTEIPLVFMHAKSERDLARRATETGASGSVQYPIEDRRLRSVLEDLFDMYVVAKPEGAAAAPQESPSAAAAPQDGPGAAAALEAGRKMLAQGDLEGAGAAFARALENAERSTALCFGLAEVCFAKGDHEAAEKALMEADRIEPFARREFRRRAPAFVQRGHQKLKEERYGEAILEFEGAIAANPKSVGGFFGLGETFRAMGDAAGAERVYQRAIEIDEEPVDLHLYNEMGLIARRKREFATALFAFDKALSFAPGDAVLHYNKAMVYVALKNYGEALPLLRKAAAIDPEFVEAAQAEGSISNILSGLRASSAA
ncbi:MAG: hypothetical protein A3J27_11090 [Candidatus Tectomicrobia bacterium RIFCSPLOWO2_12_FULL_69_37]|nr:MAG: hypothetical protein A3I72_01045 [Candidatus Tectomicrobia bacterium RIFCSPLOWO2_02_FULL_70_19]OGL64574.1 MAG: hypothetical protein A3J27_11090 [Candidatus Tectomicrobia bacterium RIFCSPLOWO2_12_FULL_69_37]